MKRRSLVDQNFHPEEVARQEELELAQKLKAEKELKELKAVLDSPEGFNVLLRLIVGSGVWNREFIHSGSENYFNNGRAKFGMDLMVDIVQACPEAATKMMSAALPKKEDDDE